MLSAYSQGETSDKILYLLNQRQDCNNLVLNAPDKLTNGRMRFVGEWNMADLNADHMANDIASRDMVCKCALVTGHLLECWLAEYGVRYDNVCV